jgi:hypothetical protein
MNLLIHRDASGIGDWVMAASVIKMLNRQFPQLQIDVAKNKTTAFITELFDNFDIDFKWVDVYTRSEKLGYRYRSGHLVYGTDYKTKNQHFIAGMVDRLNQNTKLNLKYEPEVLATFKNKPVTTPHTGQRYCVMPSIGKSKSHVGKEWGYHNFLELSSLVAPEIDIIQIGSLGDPLLPGAKTYYLGASADVVHSLLIGAKFFVGLVNGLCCLAGQHGVKSYILYQGPERPCHAHFPNQHPIETKHVSPRLVFNQLIFA